jgi:predicted ABC-type ATPase
MDYSKPTLLVISGPNGAGKSTHIQTMLPLAFEGIFSFDRDNIRTIFEKQLRASGTPEKEITPKATRMMEERLIEEMKSAIKEKKHFVLETPLSHPDYWRYIDLFDNNAYQIQLNYLGLDKINDCIARVSQRVLEGGHHVEPSTIKGVYQKNLEYINEYISTFKVVELYDGMKVPTLLVRLEDNLVNMAVTSALKKNWIKTRLPVITDKINLYLKSKLVPDQKIPRQRLGKRL